MPGFRLDQIYKNITESTYFDNPIYVSFLILIIIFIIFYFNFNPICQEHNKFWITMFRSAFYALIPTVLILCMHYKHLESDFEKKTEDKGISSAVDATTRSEAPITSQILEDQSSAANTKSSNT